MNTIARTPSTLCALLLVIASCSSGSDDTAAASGSLAIGLTGTSSSGITYTLNPARFRIRNGDGSLNVVYDGSNQSILYIDLKPGAYTIELLAGWVVNGPEGTPVTEDVALMSANPTGATIIESESAAIAFTFGIGAEFIAFGSGQAVIVTEFDDEVGEPATCPCWDGSVGSAGSSLADPGDGFSVWALYGVGSPDGPANCDQTDLCSQSGFSTSGSLKCQSVETVPARLYTNTGPGGGLFAPETPYCEVTNLQGTTGTILRLEELTVEQQAACYDDLAEVGGFWEYGQFHDPCHLAQATESPVCGDGIDSREQCDDGNTLDGDGCNASCEREFCSDWVVNGGEECDDGNREDGDGCNFHCELEFCGDGIVNGTEQCDDGNTDDNDGCSSSCVPEFCGDGIVNGTEQCDDGNTVDGDGCYADCTIEGCGNGIIEAGEDCDDPADPGCSDMCEWQCPCWADLGALQGIWNGFGLADGVGDEGCAAQEICRDNIGQATEAFCRPDTDFIFYSTRVLESATSDIANCLVRNDSLPNIADQIIQISLEPPSAAERPKFDLCWAIHDEFTARTDSVLVEPGDPCPDRVSVVNGSGVSCGLPTPDAGAPVCVP